MGPGQQAGGKECVCRRQSAAVQTGGGARPGLGGWHAHFLACHSCAKATWSQDGWPPGHSLSSSTVGMLEPPPPASPLFAMPGPDPPPLPPPPAPLRHPLRRTGAAGMRPTSGLPPAPGSGDTSHASASLEESGAPGAAVVTGKVRLLPRSPPACCWEGLAVAAPAPPAVPGPSCPAAVPARGSAVARTRGSARAPSSGHTSAAGGCAVPGAGVVRGDAGALASCGSSESTPDRDEPCHVLPREAPERRRGNR